MENGDRVKIESGIRSGDVYEYLGDDVDRYDYTTADGTRRLNEGDLVKLNPGYGEEEEEDKGAAGTIYRYLGDNGDVVDLGSANYTDTDRWASVGSALLAMEDYGDTDLWHRVNLVESPIQVQAYTLNSSIVAGGQLKVEADSRQGIKALVISGAIAASAGGTGVSLSGAGVGALNRISADVKAISTVTVTAASVPPT